MKPWRNQHTVAVLWMLVGVLLVAIVGGKVSEYEARLDWSYVQTPPKPVPASACFTATHGAWCP